VSAQRRRPAGLRKRRTLATLGGAVAATALAPRAAAATDAAMRTRIAQAAA